MPYTATAWVDGTTLGNQTRMNNLETQYTEAVNSYEQDLFTAFVFSGLVASGTVGTTTVNITSGVAFLKQSDNTLRRRAPTSSTQTTATPSSTYHLYLQPDGTWYWSTSNSPASNSLAIATVTTNGSGQISAVTDARTLNTTMLSGMAGTVSFSGGGALTATSITGTSGSLPILSQQSGSANGLYFESWNGSAAVTPFSIGGQFNSALAWIDNSGLLNLGASTMNIGPSSSNLQIATTATSSFLILKTNGTRTRMSGTTAAWLDIFLGADGKTPVWQSMLSGGAVAGFKDSSGNKRCEISGSGQLIVTAGNPSFVTTAGTSGFGNSASFDGFDVAEAYETDGEYERGAVLCPGPKGKFTRCTHDKCRAALVVSLGGALNIGGQFSDDTDYDPHIKPMALVGRVLVDTSEAIAPFADDGQPTLVTTDGQGGVRAMRPGEAGFALGYALTPAMGGQVGIVVRPVYCQAA